MVGGGAGAWVPLTQGRCAQDEQWRPWLCTFPRWEDEIQTHLWDKCGTANASSKQSRGRWQASFLLAAVMCFVVREINFSTVKFHEELFRTSDEKKKICDSPDIHNCHFVQIMQYGYFQVQVLTTTLLILHSKAKLGGGRRDTRPYWHKMGIWYAS